MKEKLYIGGGNKISIIKDEYNSFLYPSNEFTPVVLNYYKIGYQSPTGRKQIVCRTKKQVNKQLELLGSSYRIE